MFSVAALVLIIVRFVFLVPVRLFGFVFGSHRPYVEKRPRIQSDRPAPGPPQRAVVHRGRNECANRRCGYANRPSAVYCGRCGQKL
jgi:hypothetical protein